MRKPASVTLLLDVLSPFSSPHLLSVSDLSQADVLQVLDVAAHFLEVSRRPVRKVPLLSGKTVVNLFFEDSTRTRTSFELAGKRLSADVINVNVAASSVQKGETLYDTCKTLNTMHPDVIVLRHGASGAANFVAKHVSCAVINAGDGMHEHPSQALLDAFTVRQRLGKLHGLKVAICGDVMHSRVARSGALLFQLFGSEVHVVGPRTLVPPEFAMLGAPSVHSVPSVQVHHRLEPALKDADVVMILRIQRERLAGALLPSLREYARTFGVARTQLAWAKKTALVMHPGPMNRGVEIHPDVADGPQSVVLEQVEAGLAVRMALLALLAGNTSP